jgi:hypothetical protein
MNSEQLAVLSVKREDETEGSAGRYDVIANDKVIGTLWAGQELRVPYVAGRVTVQVKVWGFRSKAHTVDLQPGETVEFECAQGWPVGISLKKLGSNFTETNATLAYLQQSNESEALSKENNKRSIWIIIGTIAFAICVNLVAEFLPLPYLILIILAILCICYWIAKTNH